MSRYLPLILLAAVLLALGLFALMRCNTPPVVVTVTPVVVTVTPTAIPPTIAPTATATNTEVPTIPNSPTATPTATPTTPPTATPTPLPTPDLLGTHRVRRGDTMWGIALEWYPRRFFLWGEDVWRGICTANPQIIDCRLIYIGDVLAIPRLR